jgi:hypothetical protein
VKILDWPHLWRKVRGFDPPEHGLAVFSTRHGIAQRSREMREQRGVQ